MSTKIKPLTAIQAGNVWRAADFNRDTAACLLAIRDEHHVVLEKLTEAEVRERFVARCNFEGIPFISEISREMCFGHWLAAYRDAGLVKP